jgi:hypothetical protein
VSWQSHVRFAPYYRSGGTTTGNHARIRQVQRRLEDLLALRLERGLNREEEREYGALCDEERRIIETQGSPAE